MSQSASSKLSNYLGYVLWRQSEVSFVTWSLNTKNPVYYDATVQEHYQLLCWCFWSQINFSVTELGHSKKSNTSTYVVGLVFESLRW